MRLAIRCTRPAGACEGPPGRVGPDARAAGRVRAWTGGRARGTRPQGACGRTRAGGQQVSVAGWSRCTCRRARAGGHWIVAGPSRCTRSRARAGGHPISVASPCLCTRPGRVQADPRSPWRVRPDARAAGRVPADRRGGSALRWGGRLLAWRAGRATGAANRSTARSSRGVAATPDRGLAAGGWPTSASYSTWASGMSLSPIRSPQERLVIELATAARLHHMRELSNSPRSASRTRPRRAVSVANTGRASGSQVSGFARPGSWVTASRTARMPLKARALAPGADEHSSRLRSTPCEEETCRRGGRGERKQASPGDKRRRTVYRCCANVNRML
jgi:hypothetical protein